MTTQTAQSTTRRIRPHGFKCGECSTDEYPVFHATSAEVREHYMARYNEPTSTPEVPSAPAPAKAAVIPVEGFYTVVFDSEDDYVTLRVRVSDDEDFLTGRTIIGYLNGPDNVSNYQDVAHLSQGGYLKFWKNAPQDGRVREAIENIVEMADDLGDHREAYALKMERCARCHLPITRPESIRRGLGKVCYSKVYGEG